MLRALRPPSSPLGRRPRALGHLARGAGVALLLLLAVACLSTTDRGDSARGKILQVKVSNLQRVPEVAYTADGQHYVIRPQTPDSSLVVAKVVVVNDRSAEVSMFVNRDAAFLADRQFKRHWLVDPYTQREPLDQPPQDGGRYLPLLWGVVNVPRGYQIEGWVVFEIPSGFTPYGFHWEQADSIRVPVPDAF